MRGPDLAALMRQVMEAHGPEAALAVMRMGVGQFACLFGAGRSSGRGHTPVHEQRDVINAYRAKHGKPPLKPKVKP